MLISFGLFKVALHLISTIDLFKEVWVGATFFWKMAVILSKGILSACNDLYCSRFGRCYAANLLSQIPFLSLSSIIVNLKNTLLHYLS